MVRTVNVEQHHIEKGRKMSPTDCPIAWAFKEQHPDLVVAVGATILVWKRHHDLEYQRADLPCTAIVFVYKMFAGEAKPCTFEVEL